MTPYKSRFTEIKFSGIKTLEEFFDVLADHIVEHPDFDYELDNIDIEEGKIVLNFPENYDKMGELAEHLTNEFEDIKNGSFKLKVDDHSITISE
jgi:TRAP-type mannitol/chloroaromatic compound transport system substrate-binding protein